MNKTGRNSVKVISERSLRAVLGEAAKLFLQFMAIPLHLENPSVPDNPVNLQKKKITKSSKGIQIHPCTPESIIRISA